MKYIVKTHHQNGTNYTCVTVDDIVPALNYAREMTRSGEYPFPLYVVTEGNDEICVVVNGSCYQISDPNKIIETERNGE